MTRLLPDTNVLVYETVEDSVRHSDAVKLLDSAREIILPAIVVHEYVWVMTRKLGVDPIIVAAKLKEYMEDPRTKYTAEPIHALVSALKMLAEIQASHKEVNDFIIIATAKHYNAVIASFDAKLKIYASRLGVETIP